MTRFARCSRTAPISRPSTRRRGGSSRDVANLERGGASDLGAMLAAAAQKLDPARRGAVVYIGDGVPTVGELGLVELRDRMGKQSRPTRVFALGIGDAADMGILKGLARGAFAERVGDESGAARAALRLLEQAERPVWLGTSVDLGASVERVFPRDLSAMVADESVLVSTPPARRNAELGAGARPAREQKSSLAVSPLDDRATSASAGPKGAAQMICRGTGRRPWSPRLAPRDHHPGHLVYVPTTNEMTAEERTELQRRRMRSAPASLVGEVRQEEPEDEQGRHDRTPTTRGGTGTPPRAGGLDGPGLGQRFGIAAPRDSPMAAPPRRSR